ncbi:MAG: efflux RND transporter periplasmic adaptor subunit [Terriglobia bacterium]
MKVETRPRLTRGHGRESRFSAFALPTGAIVNRQSSIVNISLALLTASCLVLAGCSSKEPAEPGPVVTVQVAPAQKTTIERKVTSEAIVYPLHQAAITPKISAPVRKFYVDRGSHVRAGELLAELENQDLEGAAAESKGAYEQAEAAYETATKSALPEEAQKLELDVKVAKEALDAAQKVYDGRRTLYEQGAIAHKDLDDAMVSLTQAKNAYQIARKHQQWLQGGGHQQELKAAAGQLAAAKGHYLAAEAQVSYSEIHSPIDGVVTDRPAYPGEMASSSSPLITVMDLSQVVAKAHISQQLASWLKVGDAATISAAGPAPVDLPGKVTLVSPALDPGSTTVEVWVQAANPGERLKPGASVRLNIVAETVKNTIVIPSAAVITGSDGSASVMVVDSGNKPVAKNVKVGIRDGDSVQITDGLAGGEQVVTVGAFELAKEDPDVLEKTKVQVQASPEKGEEKN